LISCCLPVNAENTELVVAHNSSGAEELAKRVPGARIVAAFNTVPSEVLFGVFSARRKPGRPSLVYCGEDSGGKRVAAGLLDGIRFDPVDVGPLRISRYIESFALFFAMMPYDGQGCTVVAL